MAACPACGAENPEGFAFCGFCSASMVAEPSLESEERKVVSVLFCDLVGFTAASEQVDPEDVRASLRPYHSLLRTEIEAYGGTVEKFIGDAVMAVFGAPIAHEDDAERAIRAGLRVLESLEDLNEERGLELAVRIGINTGEAVVTLGARPEQGEGFVTGDVVNTAARIQTGAPVGGVAVGASTYASTKDVFDFEGMDPIVGKGKAVPIAAWRATGSRARFGSDLTRRHDTSLVGRETERTLLATLLDKCIGDASCQLVTITGEPGVGKSRMVYELLEIVEARPELITWRQGRCLPYGEGITFWALGEIVKADAGILESDPPEHAAEKLDRALRAHGFPAEELDWFRARLAPLVGVEAEASGEREESFTAWRRFLEGIAGSDPAVFVFEDLHWADDAMLAFLEHLADWSEGAPLLVIGTARPELTELHEGWTRGLRNASMIGLTPLSREDTARLVGNLLDQSVVPAEIQAPILERAGGNPLYAEEFVRMLKDRGLLVKEGRSWSLVEEADIPFPENVQGLIAARLDTLSPDRKSLLQDAAVLGKVFWSGALAELGERKGEDVDEALHELTRKEYIRSSRTSSMEGEREFSFWHMLVRDVAYGQIPRSARAARHIAAAEWMEARAGDRVEDLADVLAYHYSEALALTEAAGGDVTALAERTLTFLVLSAQRTANLDPSRSEQMFDRALELASADHPDRAAIQVHRAKVLIAFSRLAEADRVLVEARALLLERGDSLHAAEAQLLLAEARSRTGQDGWHGLVEEATTVLEGLPPGKELVAAYSGRASWEYVEGVPGDGIVWADKALILGEQLGLLADLRALRIRGAASCFAGDLSGLADLRRSIEIGKEQGKLRDVAFSHNELANVLAVFEGPAAAMEELEIGIGVARLGGYATAAAEVEAITAPELLYDLGRWNELVRTSRASLEKTDLDEMSRLCSRMFLADVTVCRNQLDLAAEMIGGIPERTQELGEAQFVIIGLAVVAHICLARGDIAKAGEMLRTLEAFPTIRQSWNYPSYLPELIRHSLQAVDVAFAERLAEWEPNPSMALHGIARAMVDAHMAEARGDLDTAIAGYAEAEDGWRTFSIPELGQALLGKGRCLLEMDDRSAEPSLREARDVFVSLDAQRFLPDVDLVLERAVRLSS